MDSASTINKPGSISKLPPEILLDIFLYLAGRTHPYDLPQLCQVCKAWLPIAQATLYRSVTLLNCLIREFAGIIEENAHLAPLIKHLTLDYSDRRTDWVSINRIIRVLSPHEALLSFRLPAVTRINPKDAEFIQSISSLSFLGHLDVDISIFASLHAVKEFIALFPQLHTLEVDDRYDEDVDEEWLDELGSDVPIEFPPTIRRLEYRLGTRVSLEAFLQWVPRHTEIIESFSVIIIPENSQASLGSTLRSFGAALTSLSLLVYDWQADLPSIDLRENPNLRSLIIEIEPHGRVAAYVKEQLCTLLKTLPSASLEIVEFSLFLSMTNSPHLNFMEWGVLDKAAGNANIWVSVQCKKKSQMAGVEEGIFSRMPRHLAQRKLQCAVSAIKYSMPWPSVPAQ